MTVLFYRVDDFFTTSRSEADEKSSELGIPSKSYILEFPHYDVLEDIEKNVSIDTIKTLFNKGKALSI